LIWRTTLPSKTELFNLAQDPSETTDLAAQNPAKFAELQRRIEALAREAVPPLVANDVFGTAKHILLGSVALPEDEKELEAVP
jgi:hypothetical protein